MDKETIERIVARLLETKFKVRNSTVSGGLEDGVATREMDQVDHQENQRGAMGRIDSQDKRSLTTDTQTLEEALQRSLDASRVQPSAADSPEHRQSHYKKGAPQPKPWFAKRLPSHPKKPIEPGSEPFSTKHHAKKRKQHPRVEAWQQDPDAY